MLIGPFSPSFSFGNYDGFIWVVDPIDDSIITDADAIEIVK